MAAKEFFRQTITTDQEGRYEVRLPWLKDHAALSSYYNMARKRLNNTIHRLKDNDHFIKYNEVFEEWIEDQIIEKIESLKSDELNQGHYLPHRPVIKESGTTKIRPVFDASAHEKGKPSLNHCLEKGPNLIKLVPAILLRFRENRIGVVSDIKKAFLQIGINQNDRDFLRFIWKDDRDKDVILRHRRVVFGISSSPFLLAMTIDFHLAQCLTHCDKPGAKYSRSTIEKLKRSFYVDNCVTSLNDASSVRRFIEESITAMKEGCFDLRGWEQTQRRESAELLTQAVPVLGFSWCPQKDILSLNEHCLEDDVDIDEMIVTKRVILFITQKIFDPIGYTCPTTLLPKLMLQKLWTDNLTWDQPVGEDVTQEFKSWMKERHWLLKIEIPRWILAGDGESENLSIHTFCDASQDAYACVVFLRADLGGQVKVFLLAAKSRVAPIKKSNCKITIPRLELMAATIGSRLFHQVKDNLHASYETYFWSDSSTVVSWIKRREEWAAFVSNRVQEIRLLTCADQWQHVPGSKNPADLPSRGCTPRQLVKARWWEGPEWLYLSRECWPREDMTPDEVEIGVERKRKLVAVLVNVETTDFWHLSYFSSFYKTVRMMAWIRRYIHNLRTREVKLKGELTVEELDNAETFIFEIIQRESFSGVNDKRICSLNPFVDESGIIRLKSRVSNRKDTLNYRFPIILPAKNFNVGCLIFDTHVKLCHMGTQGLLANLRKKYWILGGSRSIKSILTKCTSCRRFEAKPFSVETPPLPSDRVRDAVAFEITGVDFAGPLFLKSGQKAWICLFTCAVYRAIHMELTLSLSTPGFLQVLRRFVARRGRPKMLYSDNGTNFRGADNAFASLHWEDIVRETSTQRIVWRFNPRSAAWWGGFFERLIGVVKRLLRRILGRSCLNYEELLTLICECESVVNSRPLTYVSTDPSDLIALTPAMFLRDLTDDNMPDCDEIERDLSRSARNKQRLRDNLRSRFRLEYLGQLKILNRKRRSCAIRVGDVVLIGDDNTKCIDWPMGRVQELLTGQDGQVRVVRVKTVRGELLRPIQKLFLLEYRVTEDDAKEPEKKQTIDIAGGPPLVANIRGSDASQRDIFSSEELSRGVIDNKLPGRKVGVTRSGRTSKMPLRYL